MGEIEVRKEERRKRKRHTEDESFTVSPEDARIL